MKTLSTTLRVASFSTALRAAFAACALLLVTACGGGADDTRQVAAISTQPAGNFAIDSVWEAATFGPVLTASNLFGSGPKFCTQSKNLKTGGCFVGGVDQSGCLVP